MTGRCVIYSLLKTQHGSSNAADHSLNPVSSAWYTQQVKRDTASQAYKEGNLTGEKMREAAISWKDVFDEIPINVHSSPLATALLHTVEPNTVADGRDFARLDLSVGPLLEKNLEFLNDCLDDVVAEQQKVCIPSLSCLTVPQGPSDLRFHNSLPANKLAVSL